MAEITTTPNPDPLAPVPKTAAFGWFDGVFVSLLVSALAAVGYLGFHGYSEGRRVLEVVAHATDALAWIDKARILREAGPDGLPAACVRGGPAPSAPGVKVLYWSGCLAALRQPGQAFAAYRNRLQSNALVFSAKCDRESLPSMGSIVIENGVVSINGTTKVIAYAPIDDKDPVRDEMLLRLSVCGRGFSTISVGEVKF
jgi:hypothetical protein